MAEARWAVVCDDDPIVAWIASTLLRDEGFEVTTVGTGRELAEAVACDRPDIVVLDHVLPDTTGDALVPVLRAAAPACRVILFSGRDDPSGAGPEVFASVSKRGTDELAAAIHRAATE